MESPQSDTESGAVARNILDSSSKEQERLLPIANVSRIMKKSLPANAKISKEAKETVQECVSEFISFITGEASDKCQREKRKTINGDDLLWAMTTLGFENYVGPLKVYLNTYREVEGEKNTMARQGEQSPTEESTFTSSTNHVSYGITKVNNPSATYANLQASDAGFYTLLTEETARGYGNNHESLISYGENSILDANMLVATHYHHNHGAQW